MGALAYADDIALLAPTHSAMCRMLEICDNFATEFSVVFNAKKSKCMYFAPSVRRPRQARASKPPPQFSIAGKPVELLMNGCI